MLTILLGTAGVITVVVLIAGLLAFVNERARAASIARQRSALSRVHHATLAQIERQALEAMQRLLDAARRDS